MIVFTIDNRFLIYSVIGNTHELFITWFIESIVEHPYPGPRSRRLSWTRFNFEFDWTKIVIFCSTNLSSIAPNFTEYKTNFLTKKCQF
jgi:hypothetical protein